VAFGAGVVAGVGEGLRGWRHGGVTQLTPKSQCHVAGSLEELFGGHEVA